MIYSKSLVFQVPSQSLLLRGSVNIPSLSSHYSKGLTLSSYPHTQRQCCFDPIYYRGFPVIYYRGFPGGSDSKVCLETEGDLKETQVWSLGQEEPLKKELATHSSVLAWKIPWVEEPDRLQSIGSQRVGHNWLPFHLLLRCSSAHCSPGKQTPLAFLQTIKDIPAAELHLPLTGKLLCS